MVAIPNSPLLTTAYLLQKLYKSILFRDLALHA